MVVDVDFGEDSVVIITSNQHSICCYFNICQFVSRPQSGFL